MTYRRISETMCNPRALLASFLVLQCSLLSLLSARVSATRFQTFSGNPPKVIARGGFSGLFPDSSSAAYQLALITSVPDVVLWCDVQLTKDAVGICASDVRLENSTSISFAFPDRKKTYLVNGLPTSGYFSFDFTMDELTNNVILTQGIYSRSSRFDGNLFSIQTVEDVAGLKPQALWLNVQHDAFYTQHNLSMINYVLSVSRKVAINYISSPEVGFLRSIAGRFNSNVTKLVFRALGPNDVEPLTNQTYGNLLSNLTFIKTFASGIILSKTYIYPVDSLGYIKPHTSNVTDAHKAGLEVYASEFYNDVPLSYNYSFDPIAESLYYMDNDDFSVDGLLTDFPITPSLARDCFAHIGSNASNREDVLVISEKGASGDYPGCTDEAYEKAISDGADVIDCPVQISQNGIPFCLGSINLYEGTSVDQSPFTNRAMRIQELMPGIGSGIFAFTLTWAEIQTLKPAISNPFAKYEIFRNPKARNVGKFVSLSDFLELAKNVSSLTGVLIKIENAPYLMEKQGLPVIDTVLKTLSAAGYGNQTAKRVMIQSTDSSVLTKFKGTGNFELVYEVEEDIRDILDSAIDDIKQFAQAVVVSKSSVFPINSALFLTGSSNVVPKLKSAKLPVYVKTFSNEFVSQAWEFFSDATVEINSHVVGANVSGVITEFPLTSARYKKNRCLGPDTPPYMYPVQPGSLQELITPEYMPPAEAPNPVLNEKDITESPLPSILAKAPSFTPAGGAAAPSRPNGQAKISAGIFMSNLAAVFVVLSLL